MRVGTNLPTCMKVLNRKAYEWRRDHRDEVVVQTQDLPGEGGEARLQEERRERYRRDDGLLQLPRDAAERRSGLHEKERRLQGPRRIRGLDAQRQVRAKLSEEPTLGREEVPRHKRLRARQRQDEGQGGPPQVSRGHRRQGSRRRKSSGAFSRTRMHAERPSSRCWHQAG